MKSVLTILLTSAVVASLGCRTNDMEFAREALNRQADQNEAMATLQREVAAGARELVARDADANRRILDVHSDLQEERASLSASWRELDSHRRNDAATERRESFLAAVVRGGAATAAALFALAIARSACDRSSVQSDDELAVLLLDYLTPAEADQAAPAGHAPKQATPLHKSLKRIPLQPLEES